MKIIKIFVIPIILFLLLPFPLSAQFETKITPSDGVDLDKFGHSVSISGDYVIVGAPGDDKGKGSAYIFRHQGKSWIEHAKITAADGEQYDEFGISVSIDENISLVGAWNDDYYIGAVYIFERQMTDWIEIAKLKASDGVEGDNFGTSVAISGDHIIVGALNGDTFSGKTYIFRFNGAEWYQDTVLVSHNEAGGDAFGFSVSIWDDYVLIGAPASDSFKGSAYLYLYDGSHYTEQSVLTASDAKENALLGFSVSIHGDYVLIGAPVLDESDQGATYLFKNSGSSWIEEAKLTASDGSEDNRYGASVSLDENYAIIGAMNDNNGQGAAYVYAVNEINWNDEKKLVASDGTEYDNFGCCVSCAGYDIVIGAYNQDNNGLYSGSAYIYDMDFVPTYPGPQITSITDIPGDQGGNVSLNWIASSFDNDSSMVSFYSIWRALPESESLNPTLLSMENINSNFAGHAYRFLSLNSKDYAWEWLGNITANGFIYYADTCATLYDSTSCTDGMHYYFISAHMEDPHVFYDSNVDSGYSVDNLAPLAPTGLIASIVENSVKLEWDESSESDLYYYVLYRGGSRYDSTSHHHYTDTNVELGQQYAYKLTAIDIHENESEISDEAVSAPVPVELTKFTASVIFYSVMLEWETTSESNNYGFSIERSPGDTPELRWREIAFIRGHGTSAETHHYSYVDELGDEHLNDNHVYTYRLRQIDTDASFTYSHVITVTIELPKSFHLSCNYPNPFNSETMIRYRLPVTCHVQLIIYNARGQYIRTLVDGQKYAGYHQIRWDGTDDEGAPLPSGLYMYQIRATDFRQVGKMVFLK
ncbi:T9SS type A sorting domain-containing protein [candidate division KSB1 bacterium]|nr:T9SS type A sorting domain-containing protein [candidate division KSB1 bacterium]